MNERWIAQGRRNGFPAQITAKTKAKVKAKADDFFDDDNYIVGLNTDFDTSPATESLERRGRTVNNNGVVEGKDWTAIAFGACLGLFLLVSLIVWLIT